MTPQDGGRVAILVAGVARSGTSALSGVLAESGVRMIHSATRDEFNPLGYFEHADVTFLSAALQAVIGASAHRIDFQADIDFPEYDWTTLPEVEAIAEWLTVVIEAEAADAPLIGVKRETICRHFPLFETVLRRLGYGVRVLMPWRDPYEVAASIGHVWGLTTAHALLHWLAYVTDAERLTRHVPRAWVCYGDLIGDQKRTVEKALRTIGVPLTVPAEGFATAALRRSRPAPCTGVYPPLRALVADVVGAIAGEKPPETWDRLRARLAEIVRFIRDVNVSLIPADAIGADVAHYAAAFTHQPPPSVADYRRLREPMRETQADLIRAMEAGADAALAVAAARGVTEAAAG